MLDGIPFFTEFFDRRFYWPIHCQEHVHVGSVNLGRIAFSVHSISRASPLK